jgi:diguanylate cyclase (GGDEF)-like protein
MQIRAEKTVISAWALVCLGVASALVLRPGYLLTVLGDTTQCGLLLSLTVGLVHCARNESGRARLFWLLLALGSGMWLVSQALWTYFEVWRRQEVPNPFVGDVGIFLHLVPFMAAFAVRPDADHTRFDRPDRTDFVLLLTWWTYLYVFVVIPWQYVSPDYRLYGLTFDALYFAEHFALLVVLALAWRSSTGKWRIVYRRLLYAAVVYALSSVAASTAIDFGTYYTGSAFDIPLLIAMGMFVQSTVAVREEQTSLEVKRESGDPARYLSALANLAAFSLPLLACWAGFLSKEPEPVRRFRLALTLVAILIVGVLRSLKQYQLQQRLTKANQELKEVSLTDLLTGVRNRRFFATTIDSDVQHVLRGYMGSGPRRNNSDLIFYLVDIDHFKEVNDLLGHHAGDHLLVQIAFRISAAIRHSDVLVRWGGEEFLVVSRFTSRDEASVLCARILNAIGGEPLELSDGRTFRRTCSIGWAAFPWFTSSPDEVPFEDVLRIADRALYMAKNGGRNQAVGILPDPTTNSRLRSGDVLEGLPRRIVRTTGPDPSRPAVADQSCYDNA